MPFEAPRIEPLQRWRPWMLQSWKETTRPWLPGRFGNCFCSRSAVAVFFVLWAAQKKDFLNVRSQKRPQSWLNMATWMCQLPTSEGSGWQSVYAASLHQRLHDILQFCNNVWATKGWQCRGVSFQTLTFQVRMVRIYMNREYIYICYIYNMYHYISLDVNLFDLDFLIHVGTQRCMSHRRFWRFSSVSGSKAKRMEKQQRKIHWPT